MSTVIDMFPGQKMTLSITPVDVNGNPVTPLPTGSVVTYTSNNVNAVTVALNADGVTATATAVTPAGSQGSAVLTSTLVFTDIAGQHTYTVTDTVVTGSPKSAIAAILLNNTAPA